MRIIGPPSADLQTVRLNLSNKLTPAALFVDIMLAELWDAAWIHGIDPVGMIAQSYKETGGGTFRGNVKPWFCNTAGIKVKNVNEVMAILGTTNVDHPLVHQQFPNWRVGATAHAQHLWAYTGMPLDDMIVDPRYLYAKKGPANWAENFSDLSQRWAVPGVGYGEDIERIARTLQGRG